MLYYHDGESDFPHGAGPSVPGWYFYVGGHAVSQPNGPYDSEEEARADNEGA